MPRTLAICLFMILEHIKARSSAFEGVHMGESRRELPAFSVSSKPKHLLMGADMIRAVPLITTVDLAIIDIFIHHCSNRLCSSDG